MQSRKNLVPIFGLIRQAQLSGCGTHAVFFYGLKPNREIEVEIEPGKTLIISISGVSQPNADGIRRVFFQLNGFPRTLEVMDEAFAVPGKKKLNADPMAQQQIGAPMPGKILEVRVTPGQHVVKGQVVLITESMKMEYAISAKAAGKVKAVHSAKGELVEEGDLLVELA